MMNYGTGMWGGGFMITFMVIFWVSLIALGIWAVRRLAGRSGLASTNLESPRQILDRRFASGDIDAEAYAAARRALDGRGINPATS